MWALKLNMGGSPEGLEAFTLHALAGELAGAADGFGALTGLLLGRLFIAPAELHLAEDAFTLHLLLQGAERLIDIVVAYVDLNQFSVLQFAQHPARRAGPANTFPISGFRFP